jgi:hypothetical protein
METIAILSFIMIAPVILIGAAIFAWMQGVGFRLFVKVQKQDVPGFFKRFLIQLIYLAVICFSSYLFFKDISNASLNELHKATPFFEPTKIGILKGMVVYSLASIFVYLIVVGFITKILTKFTYTESVKSLLIAVIVSLLLYGALIAFSYKAILVSLPDELPKLAVGKELSVNTENIKIEQPVKESSNLSGIWIIDEQKSKLNCEKINDETLKIICDATVGAGIIAQAGTDGILIKNSVLQDGPNLCNLEIRNEEGYQYSCINPIDRSIYARVNPNADGSLTFNSATVSFILSRKK